MPCYPLPSHTPLSALAQDIEAMADLHEPLAELGRRWAVSVHRLKPSRRLCRTGILPKSGLRPICRWYCATADAVVLQPKASRPSILLPTTPSELDVGALLVNPRFDDLTCETMPACIPLTFLTKGAAAKRDLTSRHGRSAHRSGIGSQALCGRGSRRHRAGRRVHAVSVTAKRLFDPEGNFRRR